MPGAGFMNGAEYMMCRQFIRHMQQQIDASERSRVNRSSGAAPVVTRNETFIFGITSRITKITPCFSTRVASPFDHRVLRICWKVAAPSPVIHTRITRFRVIFNRFLIFVVDKSKVGTQRQCYVILFTNDTYCCSSNSLLVAIIYHRVFLLDVFAPRQAASASFQ